jgi:hypothetical protein
VLLTSAVTLAASLTLVFLRVVPFDIYGWIGTVATYGFITVYVAVTAAGVVHSARERLLSPLNLLFSAGAFLVLFVAAWSSVDFTAPAPLRWLPQLYLALLAAGLLWSFAVAGTSRPQPAGSLEQPGELEAES